MMFGDRMIKLRKDNKLSQEELAEALGVTRQTISNWENYKNYPDIAMLSLISDKYKISLDELLKKDVDLVKKIDKKIKRGKINLLVIVFVLMVLAAVGLYFGLHAYYYRMYKPMNLYDFKFIYPAISIGDETIIYNIPGEKQDNIEYIDYNGLHIKNAFKDYVKDTSCSNKWFGAECELTYQKEDNKLSSGYKNFELEVYDKFDLSNIKEDTSGRTYNTFSELFDEVSDLAKYNFYDIGFFTPIKKMKNEANLKEMMQHLTCNIQDVEDDKVRLVYNAETISGKYFGVASYVDQFGELEIGTTQIFIEHNDKLYELYFEGFEPKEVQDLLNTIYID